jgi:hypothetical protein
VGGSRVIVCPSVVSVVGADTEGRVIVSDPITVTEGLPEDKEDRAEEPP